LTDLAHPDDRLGAVGHLASLREAIARRARDCGRAPESVKLVAVSKTFSADDVWPTIALGGQTRFGENRVQEAIPKWRDLRTRAAEIGETIELHLIGPLQTNKAREAVESFDVIETVDRERIAAALAGEIQKRGKAPRLFVEINTGAEPQKAGVLPEDADAFENFLKATLPTFHRHAGYKHAYVMRVPKEGETEFLVVTYWDSMEAVRGFASKHHAVLLANHGPVVAGANLDAAVNAIEELEETAKLYLLLRGAKTRFLTPAQIRELE